MSLERELEVFRRKLPEWTSEEGKFALIEGDNVVGIYGAYEDALRDGYQRFQLSPFLVKQIHCLEQVQFISRITTPCHTSQGK
ncbi:MAG TPA: hypothetical protein VGL53_29620 [Bryobacteraceae bacterium]|jgi:hypothetical protein